MGAAFNSVFRVVQVAVLARILVPEDYGLMAIVTVVLAIGSVFADMGLSGAYLQRRDVTDGQRTSLFWTGVAVGAALALLLVLASQTKKLTT